MTNLPRNRLRALEALPSDPLLREPPGGHVLIGAQRPVAWHPVIVADQFAAAIQEGAPFQIGVQSDGQPAMIAFPAMRTLIDSLAAQMPPGDESADQLALLEALATFQATTAAIRARVFARRNGPTPPAPPATNGHTHD